MGQNLWNHPIASISFRVKEGVVLSPDNSGVRIAFRYTSEDSKAPHDMIMMTNSVFNSLTGELLPDREARISCAPELPYGSGFLKLASADPTVQPAFNYCYLQHPEDMRPYERRRTSGDQATGDGGLQKHFRRSYYSHGRDFG